MVKITENSSTLSIKRVFLSVIVFFMLLENFPLCLIFQPNQLDNLRMKPTFKQICYFAFLFLGIQFATVASNTPDNTTLLKKLQSKVMGNQADYSFIYNGKKVTKITFTTFDGTSRKGYFKFTYSGNLITKIQEFTNTNKNTFTSEFTYTNGKLSSVVKQEIGKNKAEKINYIYNSENSITAKRSIGNSSQQLQVVGNETLYFSENKLIKKVENGVISSSSIYEYDRANNPLQNVIGMNAINIYLNTTFGIFSSSGLEGIQNNRIKQSVFSAEGNLEYVLVFNTNYNTINFPDKKMSPPDSPGAFEYFYTY